MQGWLTKCQMIRREGNTYAKTLILVTRVRPPPGLYKYLRKDPRLLGKPYENLPADVFDDMTRIGYTYSEALISYLGSPYGWLVDEVLKWYDTKGTRMHRPSFQVTRVRPASHKQLSKAPQLLGRSCIFWPDVAFSLFRSAWSVQSRSWAFFCV